MTAFWAGGTLVILLTVALGLYRCEARKVALLRRKISAFQGGAIRPAGSPGAQGVTRHHKTLPLAEGVSL
ncbi:hypothetical protein [Acidithiobacillus ferriphilus]|uniref:hypothetical protein n=1 Tax=Acidithiobacillus ferriphilus TaxID=1689834 RepID=UPI001C065699|nr:hypothetical protein [Acidithiobacillus ferriphilus]MBU2828932.1 hypothetical protein [Acidithiobacillus ferriphilus]MBU2844256.1 hypothetical protein [Acidithiobacillus ferriphilus]MEB8475034.1 hypothetical protein [Acidithiobacillus ferriphilus]